MGLSIDSWLCTRPSPPPSHPQADLKERYSVGGLLADLAGCKASRVLLFVEQSYSGVLSKRLRGSLKHLNVVLLNSLPREDMAKYWASLHPAQCVIDHLNKVRETRSLRTALYAG